MLKSRTKKLTRWILILALIGGGLITAGGSYYVKKSIDLKSELADIILANPESAAVAAYTFDENGMLVEDEFALFHNADNPLVMASTMKIIVLAAYADAVGSGELDPNEQVSVADWERYYLPITDGGAHIMGLKSLGIETDDYGYARDQLAMVSLDDLARIMIHYSGNAATDYLLARLGTDKIASVMLEAGLEHHTPIGPTLGYALAILNHETPSLTTDQLQLLSADVSEGDTSYLDHLVKLYQHDQNWKAAQIEFMTSIKDTGGASEQDAWAYQVEASQLLPKGTAREYAHLMALIASGQLISSDVSAIIQQKLESVPSDWPLRILFFDRYGAKDGVTAGVLTLASYAVPKRGPLAEQPRVVVILINQLQREMWESQLQYQSFYLLQTDLARASGVFGKFSGSYRETSSYQSH